MVLTEKHYSCIVSGQFQPLQLYPVSVNVRKFVMRLLCKPTFSAATEDLRKPHSHLRRNAPLSVDQFGQSSSVTPSAAAASVMVRPKGSMHWRSTTDPGWGGFFIGISKLPQ